MSIFARLHFFRPGPGRRFSRLDMLVYRLFFSRWTRHFADDPGLREMFLQSLTTFGASREGPLGRLAAVPPTAPPRTH